MKQKHSILRIIVIRFIGYSLGTELVNSIIESVFSKLVYGAERDFPYDGIPGITAEMNPQQIALALLWGLLHLAVYGVGIALFARSIRQKIAEPAHLLAEGFHEVSEGNLAVTLDFDTETEFKEMRDAFNRMTQQLKDLEEKRKTMENERMRIFSHLAHDLKTPMTTITGYAGALLDGMVEEPAKQQEYHLAIKAKAEQMNGLLDQLLAYSKLGDVQYQLNLAETDLAELLRGACASLFSEMENRQMTLTSQLPEKPVLCKADAQELNRAISNLLSNAILHNPAGSRLYVGLVEEPEQVVIQIADNGAAIPEAIAGNLFEPFISGSNSRSLGSGTGLGLAIVKKVVEQHGGTVFLSQTPSSYTKMFVVKLPKNPT